MDESNGHARYRDAGVAPPSRAPAPPRSAAPSARGRRPRRRTLEELQPLVREGRYRVARHAVRHAAAEGFTERDIVGTVLHGRELMRYVEDERLLVLGWVAISPQVRIPLHVVLEFGRSRWVDVVTAFIPDDPHRAVSRTRLAQRLRYDRHEPETVWEGLPWG